MAIPMCVCFGSLSSKCIFSKEIIPNVQISFLLTSFEI